MFNLCLAWVGEVEQGLQDVFSVLVITALNSQGSQICWEGGYVPAKSLQSCLTLCDAMDSSWPGSLVHGILQARILEWVAMPSLRGSSQPRIEPIVPCTSHIVRQILYY